MVEKQEKAPRKGAKIWLIIGSFATAIFNTMALLFIARSLGVEMLGALAFLLSFVGSVVFIGDLGSVFALQATVDKGFSYARCYAHFRRTKLILTLLMTIVMGFLLVVYESYLTPVRSTVVIIAAMVPMMGYFVSNSLASIWITGAKVKKDPWVERGFELVDALVKFSLVVCIFKLGFLEANQMGSFMLSFIYLVASVMGLVLILFNSRKMKKQKEDDEIILVFTDISRKIMPFIVFTSLILSIDKILVWHWWTLSDLGLYFGAQRIVIFIGASSAAIGTILGGAVTKFQRNKKTLAESLRLTERYITLLAVPVTTFYIAFSFDLPTQFLGSDFGAASDAVMILAVAGLFVALSTPSLLFLVQKKYYGYLGLVAGVSLGLNIMLGLILIPGDGFISDIEWTNGINGAAIAMLCANALAFFGYRLRAMKAISFIPHPRIIIHFLASGIMYVILKFLIWQWDIQIRVPHIFMFAIFGGIIYILLLYLGGEMLKNDFYRFRDLVNNE
ncbi:MAG: polysaccharide biosynthesis C-terminal domain-containing protein [Thermoplasmata archaeon]|nr:polysaccharide biosynthesis C-terminal domain-containing protein [Thermoplasmata archaeon]